MARGVKRDSPRDLQIRIGAALDNIEDLRAQVVTRERAIEAERRLITELERRLAEMETAADT